MSNSFRGTQQQRARLIDTYRGEAVLITAETRIPVTCEISQYETAGVHWRTGWIAGDLPSLRGGDEGQEAVLQFPDRTVSVVLDEVDETGAAIEEQAKAFADQGVVIESIAPTRKGTRRGQRSEEK